MNPMLEMRKSEVDLVEKRLRIVTSSVVADTFQKEINALPTISPYTTSAPKSQNSILISDGAMMQKGSRAVEICPRYFMIPNFLAKTDFEI